MPNGKEIWLEVGEVISPIGATTSETVKSLKNGVSGLTKSNSHTGFDSFHLGHIHDLPTEGKFNNLLDRGLSQVNLKYGDICRSESTIVILATSKADIEALPNNPYLGLKDRISSSLQLHNTPVIISNACISGVLAINTAADFINHGNYEHAIVIGIDVISDFVLSGFNSLFALSEKMCKPFDSKRNGINIGEALGVVVLSTERKSNYSYVSGATNNDANHISGPSRTGEGLYRAITNCLERGEVKSDAIDYINAHGTSTIYNDEMESIAFERAGLQEVELNSFKSYIGHTLGASGLVETIFGLLSIENGFIAKSLGYSNHGVSKNITVADRCIEKEVKHFLKTSSGFGGCNSVVLIKHHRE